MANYNTFVVVNTKSRKTLLVTSSARKAAGLLTTGVRVEVWCENRKVETVYERDKRRGARPLDLYIELELMHIRNKQAEAEKRNRRRGRRAT